MNSFAADVEALAKRVRGPVLTPRDEGYDTERAGYQLARWHRPDLVVGATGAADVRAAVAFAGDHGLPVAVQGTGHALAGTAGEGGVLINTSRMTGVRVNGRARTAWVAAGTRWDEVIHEAAAAGLAPLSGSFPGLAVVPYTLAGGLGLLSRRYGYAADHVRALDVVTADGLLRHVTEVSEPDLFWALRGGRDNFGVVTAIELDLVPVTTLYGGSLQFAGELAAEVFDTYLSWTATVPDEMSSSIMQMSYPDLPAFPEALRGRQAVHVRIAYAADVLDDAESLVAPLRALGPTGDTLGVLPYTEAGSIHADPPFPGHVEAGTALLGDLDTAAVRAILDQAPPHAPLPHVFELRHLGGRLAHPPAVGNAVGNRDARFLLNVISRLERAEITEVRPAHKRMFEAVAPWSTGGRLLNFMNGEDAAQQVRSAYDPEDYRRLTEIKAVYDPGNTFRLNHNIPPADDREHDRRAGMAPATVPVTPAT
ncbi:FAD-binding oxidoreductase [Nonomuraea jiangxiensis]|uniref:FAD/FMN-containing dehydrogenase n=1 Tax=Nonomuraea jiangxiensis TaxID=633440 RepID=A0A1G9JM98_9ACTN|nr:FAD-binding oxidoreductase [Nonomuraea jiangxiensis]SDL38649.1 FAD/FMN-containing dehydrogenase [Nonomuraea jiangxiensis]